MLNAPLNTRLDRSIAERFRHDDPSAIEIVSARGPSALDHVTRRTAELAFQLICEIGSRRASARGPARRVHVGLGAGFTTLNVARQLAHLLRAQNTVPPLSLHAISPGFRVDRPATAPVAFFGLFDNVPHTEYVGFYAPSVVEWGEYESLRSWTGSAEAFEASGQIDLVITSLASAADPHCELNSFLERHPENREALEAAGWVGDLHYRPYSSSGPILTETPHRAVALFEIEDMVAIAQSPDRYVIVCSPPCGVCGETRVQALRPLLEQPRLAVWSHLVMDLTTAEGLVADAA